MVKANEAVQQSKAPTKAPSPGAQPVSAASTKVFAAAAAPTAPTTEAPVLKLEENVSFEEQKIADNKKGDNNKKASQKKSKNSNAGAAPMSRVSQSARARERRS